MFFCKIFVHFQFFYFYFLLFIKLLSLFPIISQITNQELYKVNKCKPLYSKFHVTQQNPKFHIIVPSKQLIEPHTLNEHEKKKKIHQCHLGAKKDRFHFDRCILVKRIESPVDGNLG